MAKRKSSQCKKRKTAVKKHRKHQLSDSSAAGGYDVKSRRKFDRGGRVEAYTMGEAAGSKHWP